MEQKTTSRVLPLLKELGIKPTDDWVTIHILKGGKKDYCYYYTFEHKGETYCVSGDSISFVFSSKQKTLYMGYSKEELRKAIKKVISK